MLRSSLRNALRVALLLVPCLAASCSSFTWKGRGGDVDNDSAALGVKSVSQLKTEYETQRYWAFWRDNWDGRVNGIRRDFQNIRRTLDRHLFNYDWNDTELYQ
jgi:hypothetical protein